MVWLIKVIYRSPITWCFKTYNLLMITIMSLTTIWICMKIMISMVHFILCLS